MGLLCSACAGPGDGAVEDPAYREALLVRVDRDQEVRDSFTAALRSTGTIPPAISATMRSVDSANLGWLRDRIEATGFPTVAQVGEDGVAAATLLIQHAGADPSFQERMVPLLERAYRAGEVTGQEVALLADRVAGAQGRPQRYGTQADIRDGRVVFAPIEDSAGVDRRRAALGLPPLAEYRRMLDSIYTRSPG